MREDGSLAKVNTRWSTGSSAVLSAVSPSLTLFRSQLTKAAQLQSVRFEDTDWPLCRADMAMSTGGSYRRVWYVQNVRAMSLLLDDLQ